MRKTQEEYVKGYKMSIVLGKPVSAVVEHVRDGTTLRVLLIPDFIQASLTGQLFKFLYTDHSVVEADPQVLGLTDPAILHH
jgi:hypothetical protein